MISKDKIFRVKYKSILGWWGNDVLFEFKMDFLKFLPIEDVEFLVRTIDNKFWVAVNIEEVDFEKPGIIEIRWEYIYDNNLQPFVVKT